jgi:uridine monophosphate synthetase
MGEYTLKSGNTSPYYVDMRMVFSFPAIFDHIQQRLAEISQTIVYDRIAAVPYGAIPFATALALAVHKPFIMVRKEAKAYGMQKLIEGMYVAGERVLLIEDVMTTGSSILETIKQIESQGLIVHDIIVLFDRQEGGKEKLKSQGYTIHSMIDVSELAV